MKNFISSRRPLLYKISFLVYFLPIIGGQKAAVSDSVEGWCAPGNLGASRVSFAWTIGWMDKGMTGRIQGKFHFIPTSFNSFIHPIIRSYCPSGLRGSFILLSIRIQGKLHSAFNICNSMQVGCFLFLKKGA